MKNCFLLILFVWTNTLFAQCDNAFAKNDGSKNIVTKASHWKVGKKFDCKLYFEHTASGTQLVIGIEEQRYKFRMETSDQIIFYGAGGDSKTFSFSKDSDRKIGANKKSTYVNQLKIKPADLAWFADNDLDKVRFVNMVEMSSDGFMLHASNKEIFRLASTCLLEKIDPSRKPDELMTVAVPKAENTPSKKEKRVIQTHPDDNKTEPIEEEEIVSTAPQASWDLSDLLLSPDNAAKKYHQLFQEELKNISDSKLRTIVLNFKIASFFYEQKRFDAAIPYFDIVLNHIKKNNTGLSYQPKAAAMLAHIYENKQHYHLAATHNSSALAFWKTASLEDEDLEFVYLAYLNQGKIFKQIETTPTNLNWYEQSAPTTEKDWEAALKKQGLTAIQHQKEKDKSVDYNLALLSFRSAQNSIKNFDKNQPDKQIETQLEIARLYYDAGDLNAAKKHYLKTLNLLNSKTNAAPALLAETQRMLSEISLAEQAYEEASRYLGQAQLTSLGKNGQIDESILQNLDQLQQPIEVLHFIASKGKVTYKKNAEPAVLQNLLKEYDIASKVLHKIRKTHRNEGDAYRLHRVTDKLSQQAILVCEDLYQQTKEESYLHKAFFYAELSKSGVPYELTQVLKAASDIPQEEIIKENGLKNQLAHLKKELFKTLQEENPQDKDMIKKLERELSQKQQEYQALLQHFEQKYSQYYTLKYSEEILDIKTLQQHLSPNEVFLQYVANDSFIYVLAIHPTKIESQLKYLDKSLSRTVQLLQYALKKNDAKFYQYSGYWLYQNAIGELSKMIQNKKLIICPDAELYYIPFGVLPTQTSENQDKDEQLYANTHFFIQDHAICYNHSAEAYVLSKEKHSDANKQQIATWAPSFETMHAVIKAKGIGEFLAPLPGAAKEAKEIAAMFGNSKVYLAQEASELNFKTAAKNYNILHIATHGLLDDVIPMSSSLVFTNQNEEDGLLQSFELYTMNLDANLAVLSACNSGMGRLSKNEGVIGVASGFAYAGVPNIVMSKWPVSDLATQILMKSFYLNLQDGMPKDEALQQAKLAYLENNKNQAIRLAPFFWGGFVLSGNNLPIEALGSGGSSYAWIGLLLLIFLVIGTSIYLRKRNNTNQTI